MELTYDEIWTRMDAAKKLYDQTGDRLVRSAIPILVQALARADNPDEPITLQSQEETVVNGIEAMQEAWFCLYGR